MTGEAITDVADGNASDLQQFLTISSAVFWSTDNDGRVTVADEAQARRLGLPRRFDGTEAQLSFVHPDDRDRIVQESRRVQIKGGVFDCECRARAPGRSYRWIRVRARFDAASRRWFGSTEDVHERREAKVALRVANERLALALEGSDAWAWDFDVRSGSFWYSDGWRNLLGYGAEEIAHDVSDLDALVHPDDRAQVSRSLRAHLAGHTADYEAEYRVRKKDGDWVWLRDRGRVVERDGDGRPLRAGRHGDRPADLPVDHARARRRDPRRGAAERRHRVHPDPAARGRIAARDRAGGAAPGPLASRQNLGEAGASMSKWVKVAVALASLTGSAAAAAESYKPDPNVIGAHMSFLAADEMRGREAGTRDYDIAANYVASRFMEYALKPAGGDSSYLQRVPMTTYVPSEGRISVTPRRGGTAVPLVFGEDYFPGATPLSPQVKLEAPLAFAGFGVVAPGYKHDDYKGLDVKDKIVVVLTGAPKRFQGEERAHYGNGTVKRAEAAKRGAVGMITLYTPTREKVLPFERLKLNWNERQMTWNDAAGRPWYPAGGVAPVAVVSMKGAEKLFAGAPATVAEIMATAEAPAGAVPRFALPQRAKVELTNEIGQAVSPNVAGMIEGSDPKLRNEVIVLSGHLDHEGVGAAQNGDSIYNGAMDNASGIATMLEVAHAFKHDGVKPKRSVMFLAVTAEEKGLIGAEYFAHNPTVPKASLAANVNLDMPILTYDFKDVVAFGADRSTIGGAVKRAAESLGLAVSPDPDPDQGIFTRSDHYRFVQQGVPSVFLKTGPANGGAAADKLFRSTRYHRPNDDLSQPIDYDAAARFAAVNYAIARELADVPERPRWNKGDFFGTLFGGPGAK